MARRIDFLKHLGFHSQTTLCMSNIEIWKDIEGYEGLYQVSNKSRIKSLKRSIILKGDSKNGYRIVLLWKNGHCEKKYVHRLILKRSGLQNQQYVEF